MDDTYHHHHPGFTAENAGGISMGEDHLSLGPPKPNHTQQVGCLTYSQFWIRVVLLHISLVFSYSSWNLGHQEFDDLILNTKRLEDRLQSPNLS